MDVAFVVIGIVHDRVPRNNQRGNLAPDELGSFGARSPHAARSFERVPAAPLRPLVWRARSGDARRETYWDNINILMINTALLKISTRGYLKKVEPLGHVSVSFSGRPAAAALLLRTFPFCKYDHRSPDTARRK